MISVFQTSSSWWNFISREWLTNCFVFPDKLLPNSAQNCWALHWIFWPINSIACCFTADLDSIVSSIEWSECAIFNNFIVIIKISYCVCDIDEKTVINWIYFAKFTFFVHALFCSSQTGTLTSSLAKNGSWEQCYICEWRSFLQGSQKTPIAIDWPAPNFKFMCAFNQLKLKFIVSEFAI